jgi:hypothetical protein
MPYASLCIGYKHTGIQIPHNPQSWPASGLLFGVRSLKFGSGAHIRIKKKVSNLPLGKITFIVVLLNGFSLELLRIFH